ncbi:penicillin-binding protein 1C [Pseudodesulfovibrio sp. F-1]|uniref:peptidoglycan glycosyltransferase n=1 Tax=Pseudodesulfovibrio alkaliphilus TaxID=2661613 RepID=A0A7K1KMS3_9BACT|nr:penicillin-binding protein 1C [Pseudodesulfovibrio alkaliphilus]MUM77375.1 penicillin-binding protein 1C [Pseudodesulfovibrio alkaliphilus]
MTGLVQRLREAARRIRPLWPKRAWVRLALVSAGLLLAVPLAFLVLDALFPLPAGWLDAPSGTRLLDRSGTELRRFPARDGQWRFPVTLDEVSPALVTALVESEDRWFFVHPGVNPLAALRAAWTNAVSGRVVSGASTIPMQLARMADPGPRTLRRKLAESFRALQLGLTRSKAELLEAYLNTAPFGGNIVGVGAAARIYFGKPPDRLSLGECALLAVLPRSPNRYDPSRHPEAAMAVRDRVLALLTTRGVADPDEARRAMRQPMVAQRRPSPMSAPHFCLLARARLGSEPVIATSLDLARQRTVERLLARHVERLRDLGIGNGAAVVLDRTSREVLALAGSADFADDRRQGQVNNALAPRSPGSTLKPFLYALAFDRGLAVPGSRLLDVPVDYAGYAPENYSGTFSGRVSVAEALTRSLNVPAVRLLATTGLRDFHSLLRQGGLETIDRPATSYGLPLVLGACEVRLVDLTNLYATLGQGGVHRPWRVTLPTQADPAPAGPPGKAGLFSPEAARVVADMLTEVARPDMPDSWRLTRDRPAAAWKTGTSFGHRDAWAVGFGPTLAVGVWVGNPDGTPVKGISGAVHAGPLFFDLLRALDEPGRDLRLPEAPALRSVTLCSASGLPAGPDCPATIQSPAGPTLALPRCAEHRRILVDRETGLRLEGSCLAAPVPGGRAEAGTAQTVPPELAAWMAAQGKPAPGLPPLSPLCPDVPGGLGPTILSPSSATPYVMRHDAPAHHQQVALRAAPADPGDSLWWYVDGRFVGVVHQSSDRKEYGKGYGLAAETTDVPAHEPRNLLWPMTPGEHRASVTDGQGRTSTVTFRVLDRSAP